MDSVPRLALAGLRTSAVGHLDACDEPDPRPKRDTARVLRDPSMTGLRLPSSVQRSARYRERVAGEPE